MKTYIRMFLNILMLCVTHRGLTAQPTTDYCCTDNDNNHQLDRVEQMISMLQTISERQVSLMEQIQCTLQSTNIHMKENQVDVSCQKSLDGKQTCYRIIREAMDWEAARVYCRSYMDGMDLVSIESAEEHAFLVSYIQKSHRSCVEFHTSGKKDAAGVWKWMATGQPFHFTSWAPGQPDNTGNYCYIWNRQPGWNTWDDYVDGNRCFLCEYDISVSSYCHK